MKNLFLLAAVLLLLVGCAQSVPLDNCIPQGQTEAPYGFWWGLWNGMTSPYSSIGRLFDHDIEIYAVNNTGTWYDIGFMLGITGLSGTLWNGVFGTSEKGKD